MSRKSHLKGFSVVSADMKVRVNMERINRNLDKAQYWLDSQIMHDMEPFMPMNEGNFINVTRTRSRALAGSGLVVAAAAPMGRFLYEGKVMVDPVTNSPWAQKGSKKVVTAKPLTYSNPRARPEWFEVAKKKHKKEWIQGVQKKAGGK